MLMIITTQFSVFVRDFPHLGHNILLSNLFLKGLGHSATNRKVASSIPDGAIRIFHWFNFRPHHEPGIDSTTDRKEYDEYFQEGKGDRCVGLTTLPPSCSDCLEIWEPRTSGALRACIGIAVTYYYKPSSFEGFVYSAATFCSLIETCCHPPAGTLRLEVTNLQDYTSSHSTRR